MDIVQQLDQEELARIVRSSLTDEALSPIKIEIPIPVGTIIVMGPNNKTVPYLFDESTIEEIGEKMYDFIEGVGFHETSSELDYWGRLKLEFHELICLNDKKYADIRKRLALQVPNPKPPSPP
jgi:hypothetical protein